MPKYKNESGNKIKDKSKLGAQNFQCPSCTKIKQCKKIYTEELWRSDGKLVHSITMIIQVHHLNILHM